MARFKYNGPADVLYLKEDGPGYPKGSEVELSAERVSMMRAGGHEFEALEGDLPEPAAIPRDDEAAAFELARRAAENADMPAPRAVKK